MLHVPRNLLENWVRGAFFVSFFFGTQFCIHHVFFPGCVFQQLGMRKIRDEPPLSAVHDASLLRTKALEIDLRRLLGPNWTEDEGKKNCGRFGRLLVS